MILAQSDLFLHSCFDRSNKKSVSGTPKKMVVKLRSNVFIISQALIPFKTEYSNQEATIEVAVVLPQTKLFHKDVYSILLTAKTLHTFTYGHLKVRPA